MEIIRKQTTRKPLLLKGLLALKTLIQRSWPKSTSVFDILSFCGLLLVIGFLILGYVYAVLCVIRYTDNTLDFWASFFKHAPFDVPIWVSIILLILNEDTVLSLIIVSAVIRAFM